MEIRLIFFFGQVINVANDGLQTAPCSGEFAENQCVAFFHACYELSEFRLLGLSTCRDNSFHTFINNHIFLWV